MLFTDKMKTETRQGLIDIHEAFNLWDVLKSKYDYIELAGAIHELTHDLDFKIVLSRVIKDMKTNAKILENLMEKFQISGPDRGRLPSNWSSNHEVLRDELNAQILLTYLQEHIENLLRAIRRSFTNDEVRQAFHSMLIDTTAATNDMLKYLKLKGWIEQCPTYLNTPPENKEMLSCAAASTLWDHVTFRYDNLRKTKGYAELAHDLDFKAIVLRGVNLLETQVITFEKECQKFGIPLPKRPPVVIVTPVNKDIFSDDFMYRDILAGLKGASTLHAQAAKQCVFNDRIRALFIQTMNDEIDFFEQFVKYGKTKGWVHPVPSYRV